MAGPWESFATAPPSDGPWIKFKDTSPAPSDGPWAKFKPPAEAEARPLNVYGDLPSSAKLNTAQVPEALAPEGGIKGFLKEGAQQLGRVTEAPGIVGGQIKDDFNLGKDLMNLGRKEFGEGKHLEGAFDVYTGGMFAAASPFTGTAKAIGNAMDPGFFPEATGEAGRFPEATGKAGRIAGEAPKAVEAAKEAPKVPEAPRAIMDAPVASAAPKETPAPAPSPKPLGAEAPPASAAMPERPSKPMIAEQDDRFFRLRQGATADKAELSKKVEALPPEAKTPAMQEKMYRYMEGDPNVSLTPAEQAIYDQHVAPLKVEERALYEELKKTDLPTEDFDPEYAHRIVKGKAPQFDALEGDATMANPQGGTRSLPQSTSALKPRKYFVLEDETGARRVVAIDKGNISAVSKDGKPTPIPHTLDDPGVGDALSVGGKKWTIKNARTSEIEANTNTEYYKNAMANTVDNVARLRATARAVHEVQRLKDSPEFAAYARPSFAKDIPSHWREPTMPLFRDWRMEPRLADVIDDFYGKRSPGDAVDWLAKVNRFAVGSLFWSPVPHALNAGAHWVTARGWDWITPKGVRSLVTDSAQAVRSVIAQDEKYQQMLRDGSGLVYGGVANKDFYMKMMKRLGEDVKANPAKWDPIARALGVGPSDVVKMLYSGSNKALWAVSDMFMMQRVMELERKGMSAREAIAEAEKHIPNYRIPPEVLNSRLISEVLQNPTLTEFSRYHYGMLKSFGHMAKDMAVGTPKQKFETMGNIMATAALMTIVWPAINYGISKVTGNKDTTLGPKGSTTIPSAVKDMYNGDADWVNVLSNLVTMAPVLRAGLEAFPSNTNWFTGKRIADPDDARHGRIGRVAAQEIEHAAQNIVQPYSMLNSADKTKKGLAEAIIDQGLGLRKRTKEQEIKKKGAFKAQASAAARRAAKPDGLIERGYGNAEKAVKKKLNEYRGTQQ